MKKPETVHYFKNCGDMIIRDYLALDRTVLANKRTLLAYIRTFIALIASGVGLIELLANLITEIIGWLFIGMAIPILIFGFMEYYKKKKALSRIGVAEKENLQVSEY